MQTCNKKMISSLNKIYDIIIIGGGIAGLYCAYKIKQLYPSLSFLILEKSNFSNFGGRLGNYDFYGESVVKGAGIGRFKKDILLQALLNRLGFDIHTFPVSKQYAPNMKNHIVDIDSIHKLLCKKYKSGNPSKWSQKTFREFAIEVLGNKTYKNFVLSIGYQDYENEDIEETLFKYGIEDSSPNEWIAFSVPWKQLIEKLADNIGYEHIKFNQDIISFKKSHSGNFIIKNSNCQKYYCNKIIVATTIESVHKLFKSYPIYRNIGSNVFLRLYGKFSKKSINIMKEHVSKTTIVSTRIQKVIPINTDKGIYMICYCDDRNAISFQFYLENTSNNRKFWENELEKALSLEHNILKLRAIKAFYWPVGTHYYKPLNPIYKTRENFVNIAQHPNDNILVVGEMISRKHGWTEGALESVEKVITKKWINSK